MSVKWHRICYLYFDFNYSRVTRSLRKWRQNSLLTRFSFPYWRSVVGHWLRLPWFDLAWPGWCYTIVTIVSGIERWRHSLFVGGCNLLTEFSWVEKCRCVVLVIVLCHTMLCQACRFATLTNTLATNLTPNTAAIAPSVAHLTKEIITECALQQTQSLILSLHFAFLLSLNVGLVCAHMQSCFLSLNHYTPYLWHQLPALQ